jgi:hypothetical protein
MTGGCGTIFAKADTLEEFVFSQVLPLADNPKLRDAIRTAEKGSADEAAALIHDNAEDSTMLEQLETDYTDRAISRAAFMKQSGRLRERIEDRSGQIAAMRGHSALDRLGGSVTADWDTMSADDKRLVTLAIIDHIDVRSAGKAGRYDPTRLRIYLRFEAVLGKGIPVDLRGYNIHFAHPSLIRSASATRSA